ncbi:MAG: type II secretion system protein GspH [Gammaproteobacteria bacterium]|nr:type II secretion system protein GspH [Gammaproteobacteria bacterium]
MKKNGFTLIEILVVLVIIGIVVAAATLAINKFPRGQDARTTANILRARLLTAEEKAVVQSVSIGFAVSQQGYQFYQLNTQADGTSTWQVMTTPAPFTFQKWPSFLSVQLDLPPTPNVLIANDFPPQPNIMFDPSGGVTPFILHLNKFTLEGKLDGTIDLH